MIIYLIGFMGCGKSTMGRNLAKLLGFDFSDLDRIFEKQEKMTIASYFEKYGEETFRQKERDILHAVNFTGKGVISTGGGTPCYFDNMQYMKAKGVTVYMKLTPEIIARRLETSHTDRPMVKAKTYDELLLWAGQMLEVRNPVYESAHIVADARSLMPASLVKVLEPYLAKGNE